jgi:hypothetical protein
MHLTDYRLGRNRDGGGLQIVDTFGPSTDLFLQASLGYRRHGQVRVPQGS